MTTVLDATKHWVCEVAYDRVKHLSCKRNEIRTGTL